MAVKLVLKEKDVAFYKRTESAMMRAMHGMKSMDKKNTKKLLELWGVSIPLERIAEATAVRWYLYKLQRKKETF